FAYGSQCDSGAQRHSWAFRCCNVCSMKPLLLTLLTGSIVFAQAAPGNETILSEHLKADLYFLAGDSMRGRLTATNEYAIAAEWIEARFKRLGLKPAGGKDSYFHRFDLVLARLAGGNALSI